MRTEYNNKLNLNEQPPPQEPTETDAICQLIDTYISAELPSEHDEEVHEIVSKLMIHTCRNPNQVNSCLNNKKGVCKDGYDKNDITDKTTFNPSGFPIYRRRREADKRVVAYNRDIVLDWGGHAHLTYSGQTFSVLYLYKYLYKGNKKMNVGFVPDREDEQQLSSTSTSTEQPNLPLHPKDEIGKFNKGRRICAADAMWRLLRFQTYPAPYPAIKIIKSRMPEFVESFTKKGKLTDLFVYFNRPNELDNLTYTDFMHKYVIMRKPPSSLFMANKGTQPNSYFYLEELDEMFGTKPVYIQFRENIDDSMIRLEKIDYTAGEAWYLRLILKTFPKRNFNDCKTHNGRTYNNFQEAVIAMGLIKNDTEECLECFTDAILTDTAIQLRSLFVTMTVSGFPTLAIYENKEYWSLLYADLFAPKVIILILLNKVKQNKNFLNCYLLNYKTKI